jgi:hypothetical protein
LARDWHATAGHSHGLTRNDAAFPDFDRFYRDTFLKLPVPADSQLPSAIQNPCQGNPFDTAIHPQMPAKMLHPQVPRQ